MAVKIPRRRSAADAIVTAAVAALVAVAAGSALLSGGASVSRAIAPGAARVPGQSRPAMQPLTDLSARVSIANGECSFGPALDRALHGMIVFEGDPPVARAGRVALGGRRLTADLVPTKDDSARPDFHGYLASLDLNPAARWNGLRLTGLQSRTGWEWSARSLEFAESPARVRAALLAMHLAIPLPPGRRDIPTDACALSIAIEARPHGSALTCSGGC